VRSSLELRNGKWGLHCICSLLGRGCHPGEEIFHMLITINPSGTEYYIYIYIYIFFFFWASHCKFYIYIYIYIYIYNLQCDAQNPKHYVIICTLMQPPFKFQSTADHYRHLIPLPLLQLQINISLIFFPLSPKFFEQVCGNVKICFRFMYLKASVFCCSLCQFSVVQVTVECLEWMPCVNVWRS
jgi:hypothetical protein